MPSCKRNRVGFLRKWNLQDHCKRRHNKELSAILSIHEHDLISDDGSEMSDLDFPISSGSTRTRSVPDIRTTAVMPNSESFLSIRREIQGSLLDLRRQRDIIDGQIEALRKAMQSLEQTPESQRRWLDLTGS
jgi:hypothetical protein